MPDFSQLLSKPVGQIEKPKPLPSGTYFGVVTSYEFGESPDKKTPFVRFHLGVSEPGPDVERELLDGVDLTKKKLRRDFYITEDAEYRLKEFLLSVGVTDGGGTRSLGEMIPEAKSRPVMVSVSQVQSQRDPTEFFNNVDSLTGRPE